MKLRCPRCSALVDPPAQGVPVCLKCGFGQEQAQTAHAGPTLGSAPSPYAPVSRPVQATDGLAVAALVTGIVGLLISFLGILAIVFGGVSLSRIKKQPELGGRGMAIAGLVMGIIAVVFMVLYILVFVMLAAMEF